MAKFGTINVQSPPPVGNPDLLRQIQTGSERTKKTVEVGDFRSTNYIAGSQGWRLTNDTAFFHDVTITGSLDGSVINGATITGSTITGGTLQTDTSGKRVEISNDEIRIYDASDVLVATLSGTAIGGLASAVDAIFGIFSAVGLRDDATGDPFAIGSGIDGAVMMDVGDVAVSARLSGGGGGSIKLIPDVGVQDKVIVYQYMRIVPGSEPSAGETGDLYVNSGNGKLYIYNGAAWVVVGTQS